MSSQPHSLYPEPWAQARRISEEWKEAGRDGADRQTQIARVKAARARRAAVVSEARLRATVDTAVREALARPEVAEALDQLAPAAVQPPSKPLHEMNPEEWRSHAAQHGPQAFARQPRRPMTIGELVAGRHGGDEA